MKSISRFNRYKLDELLVDESIFAVQNGFIGIRGNFCEGYGKQGLKQTLLNGFYNYYDYRYEENSPAFPQKGQRIINIIDGQSIEFYVNGIPINLTTCKLRSLERHFDLEKGYTTRKSLYQTEDGNEFLIEEEKMVSFVRRELAIIRVKITSLNYSGDLSVVSSLIQPKIPKTDRLDPRINQASKHDLVIEEKITNAFGVNVIAKTTSSNLYLCVGMSHMEDLNYRMTDEGIEAFDDFQLEPKKSYELTKLLVYTPSTVFEDVLKSNQNIMQLAIDIGFQYYFDKQEEYLKKFWEATIIEIEGDDTLDTMIQYNAYQLSASALRDPVFNIPAKGLTGEGYEGHYFWDTEIYMIPFFLITNPEIAKSLLLFRYNHFPEAREEALKQGSPIGVKIPWRTINGQEASPYFPAGSAQYHINSDLAYSIIKYYEFTDDYDFMINYGFEMLLETARFLFYFGTFSDGDFHINGVTGPDEYTTLINDNYYTNSLAKYHFEYLTDFYRNNKESLKEKIESLAVTEKEIDDYALAAQKMHFSFNEKSGIFAQDHSFLRKKELDLHSIPKENFPLLLHYHPLFIYKHQVLKQADVLLSMFLLDFENTEIFKKNFDFYLPKTSHDSSLSKCIHSIVAFRLGETDLAYQYFLDALKIDFDDTHKNTNQGLHIANSGGSYLAILYGILGLRIKSDTIFIRPNKPNKITGIRIRFKYKDTDIDFHLTEGIDITVSKPLKLGIYKDMVFIEKTYHCDYIMTK